MEAFGVISGSMIPLIYTKDFVDDVLRLRESRGVLLVSPKALREAREVEVSYVTPLMKRTIVISWMMQPQFECKNF